MTRRYCVTAVVNSLPHLIALSFIAFLVVGCSNERNSKGAHLARANDYFAAEQYDKAEKEYREVLRLAPDDAVAVRQLGIIYQEQGQLAEASRLLQKAAELDPNDVVVQQKLGVSYL